MTDNENQRLGRMESTLDSQGSRLDRIETTLETLVTEIKIYGSKLDAYQKASQQVVNIAFGLLATGYIPARTEHKYLKEASD